MADTVEMLRIIRHAANLLEFQCKQAIQQSVDVRAIAAATATGAAVLRMVAACMDDEPAPAEPEPQRGPDGRFRRVHNGGAS